ncbi:MAG: UDP-4-amino-4,6-dideoxy-N-acetyl-beta-L-altrosamine transaminase [Gammaproteobacteria bacterium]|nr:UDP-4-amino-4,6-dideoxy-N-acetyl-beta-L-altrosamine transaminase [Gammaproteobacteria bacterium]
MIPYNRQSISEEDIDAVVAVLRSSHLTQGPEVAAFEAALCSYCHAPFAVTTTNGTAALHLALLALDVGPGDRVWTTPNTFLASANAALYCQAEVDFVDIDYASGNLDPHQLTIKLETAKRVHQLPKALIVVHFGGNACQMEAIKAVTAHYGIALIEDAAHALGSSYSNGEKIGSCHYADVTTFSFHPIKSITTGEGGAILTRDSGLAAKARLLASHGVVRGDPDRQRDEPWQYQQQLLGYNLRLSDIAAALGHSQLQRLDRFLQRRRQLAQRYHHALQALPVDPLTPEAELHHSAWHLYPLHLQEEGHIRQRATLVNQLLAAGIATQVHFIPVHTQPWYQKLGFHWGDFPEAERHYHTTISLPLFPDMGFDQQEYIIATLSRLLKTI